MGSIFSRVFGSLFGKKEARVLILGLDNAGKTTLLYRLHSPQAVVRTAPTIGFNVETISVGNISMQAWDLGGQSSLRPYWRCYVAGTNALIYVVDSSDTARIGTTKKELMSMLEEEELKDAVLLVLANKQDQKGALSEAEVSEAMGLAAIQNRPWHIAKTVAVKGEGLEEAMKWLSDAITGAK